MSKKAILVSVAAIVALLIITIALSGCGPKYTLRIIVEGQGVVTLNSEGPYKSGTVVQLKATAAEGYAFSHWSGADGASVKANKIIMDGNKSIVAVFVKLIYDLTVDVSPVDAGTVTVIIAEDKSSHEVEHGQTVQLTASPNAGYRFVDWDNNPDDTANPKTIVVDEDKTIVAHFAPILEGRVLGVRSLAPIAGVTVYFSDGGVVVTDANGYWVKTYDPASPPSGPITMRPLVNGFVWEVHTPSSAIANWPAEEIVFHFEACRFITKWGSLGNENDKLKFPNDVAVDAAGNVYAADTYNDRVQKFTSTGEPLGRWGTSGTEDGQFQNPYGIAADAAGNIYVADRGNHRIQKFDSNGQFITQWGNYGFGAGNFNSPNGVATDAVGNIYVVDTNNDRIRKFTSDGIPVAMWGSYGTNEGQFARPRSIVADSDGNVYVTDYNNHRIQKFTSDGQFVAQWGSNGTGDNQFSGPWGVAIDTAGNIYVADSCNHRIQVFTSDGQFLAKWGIWGGSSSQFTFPSGLAVDAADNIYVADTNQSRVQKFVHLD
jgi:sugar lactone lactonase YvrE